MFESVIGLEIHIQLTTESKIFCGCKAAFGDEPNTNVCPVCMGYPGVLPALNGEAMRKGYLVARALNCTLAKTTIFDRKNYFYPDLPKNYQISQFHSPVGVDGKCEIVFQEELRNIRIHDVHLEEDAGKMIHAGDMSLLDFNRTGTPLLEIVTQPDLKTGEEAEAFLKNFRRIVRYLGVCDGNMEEGSLRCDANVSVNRKGEGLGNKVEIKNMNSFKFVRKALEYEIKRQVEVIENGGRIVQETRLWNENRDVTEGMRSKEESTDYRYFPDPDLPPFRTDAAFLKSVEEDLVELPLSRQRRFVTDYGLTADQADFICDEIHTADFFENTVSLGGQTEVVARWLQGDIRKQLNRESITLLHAPITPKRLASLLNLLEEKRIHGKIAKKVLEAIFIEDKDPETIIEEKGWEQITDKGKLAGIIRAVLEEQQEAMADLMKGEEKVMGFLIGQIMKKTSGQADPEQVKEMIKENIYADTRS